MQCKVKHAQQKNFQELGCVRSFILQNFAIKKEFKCITPKKLGREYTV